MVHGSHCCSHPIIEDFVTDRDDEGHTGLNEAV